MESLVESGEEWLEPLLDFRDWLASTGDPERKHEFREIVGRDGRVIFKDGNAVARTYKLEASKEALRRLLRAQQAVRTAPGGDPNIQLIEEDELLEIHRIWKTERQDWSNSLLQIVEEITGVALVVPPDDDGGFDDEQKALLESLCAEHAVPFNLVARLLEMERQYTGKAKRVGITNEIESILHREYRPAEEILQTEVAQQTLFTLQELAV
jgi:DNA sulfur modification protein DndC